MGRTSEAQEMEMGIKTLLRNGARQVDEHGSQMESTGTFRSPQTDSSTQVGRTKEKMD